MSSRDHGSTAITHINQFPSEILAHIFSVCEFEKDNCAVLLDLACVCKHWHGILWSFPRFWTSHSLSVPMKLKNDGPHGVLLPKLCNHLERWCGRAGDVPRDLSLSFEQASSRTLALYNYFTGGTRWKTLSLSFNLVGASNWTWLEGLISAAHRVSQIPSPRTGEPKSCWPDLTRLEIVTPTVVYSPEHLDLPLEHIAPNLTHLKIHISELRTSVFSVFASSPNAFANLTTFDWKGGLGTESLAFYMHLLSTAPKLEVLRSYDQQHDFDETRALPEKYAKLVPLRHEVLREVCIHWSPNAAVLLKSVALPRLKTLDLARVYDPSHIASPPDNGTPVADAVKALMLNSTKATTEMGTTFALTKLRLEKNPLVEKDLYEVVMAVRDTVKELILHRAACWWHTPADFFTHLDNWVHGRSDNQSTRAEQDKAHSPEMRAERSDLFPDLELLTVVSQSGYPELSFSVSSAEPYDFAIFKTSPLAWWNLCQLKIDQAEATRYLHRGSWDDSYTNLSEYRGGWLEEWFDEGDDEVEWEDEDEDEDEDEEVDGDDDDEEEDAIGPWNLATMTMAPHPHYEG